MKNNVHSSVYFLCEIEIYSCPSHMARNKKYIVQDRNIYGITEGDRQLETLADTKWQDTVGVKWQRPCSEREDDSVNRSLVSGPLTTTTHATGMLMLCILWSLVSGMHLPDKATSCRTFYSKLGCIMGQLYFSEQLNPIRKWHHLSIKIMSESVEDPPGLEIIGLSKKETQTKSTKKIRILCYSI